MIIEGERNIQQVRHYNLKVRDELLTSTRKKNENWKRKGCKTYICMYIKLSAWNIKKIKKEKFKHRK